MFFSLQWLDNAGMYLVVSSPMLFSRANIRLFTDEAESGMSASTRYLLEWFALNSCTGAAAWIFPPSRRYIFLALIFCTIAYEMHARRKLPSRKKRQPRVSLLVKAIAAFVLATIVWTLDIKHIVCSPKSIFQGHSLWHCLNGVSCFLAYSYFHPFAYPSLPLRHYKK